MEQIEFCKADFLYMLNELNKYAIENDVKNVWINHMAIRGQIEFVHFNSTYERNNKTLAIKLELDTHEEAYEKFEKAMKCMKEGALL